MQINACLVTSTKTDAAVEAARTEGDTAKDGPDHEEHLNVSAVSAQTRSPLSVLIDTPDSSHTTRPARVRLDQPSSRNFAAALKQHRRLGGRGNDRRHETGSVIGSNNSEYLNIRASPRAVIRENVAHPIIKVCS